MVVLTAASMALLGLTFTCPGGIHMFTLFNESAPSWNLLLFALLEVVLISWAYGADKFLDHLEDMIPHFSRTAKAYWKFSWKYSTPIVLFILLISDLSNFGHIKYEDYVYPLPVQLLGYAITGASLIWLPTMALIQQLKRCDF